jgi:hypothetical protein
MIDEHHEGAAICHKIIILCIWGGKLPYSVCHTLFTCPCFITPNWQTDEHRINQFSQRKGDATVTRIACVLSM